MTAALKADWRPGPADVARALAWRGPDDQGDTQATFTATTVPTEVDVGRIITQIQGEVLASIDAVPEQLAEASDAGGPASSPAGGVVVLGAAASVDLNFPDTDSGRPSETAKIRYTWYQTALGRLISAAKAIADGGTASGPSEPLAAFWFPQAYSPTPHGPAETSDPTQGVSMTTWYEPH